jgi:hypothetical protein
MLARVKFFIRIPSFFSLSFYDLAEPTAKDCKSVYSSSCGHDSEEIINVKSSL